MAFIRKFDIAKLSGLVGQDAEIYTRLKADVFEGLVFPAVRAGRIDFYHRGGCLYSFREKSFERNDNYNKPEYAEGTTGLDSYSKAKKQNENKFRDANGVDTERMLLDRLNNHTFGIARKTKVVVLDIEVCLNGEVYGRGKCDMVLLNTATQELMFVEGKVFSDNRVNTLASSMPKVIEQINNYTTAITEQKAKIVEQYAEHIKIVNALFGRYEENTIYNPHITLIPSCKLLVMETPPNLTNNNQASIDKITIGLKKNNVIFCNAGIELTIDEIWEALCE